MSREKNNSKRKQPKIYGGVSLSAQLVNADTIGFDRRMRGPALTRTSQ